MKHIQKIISIIQEDIIGTENRFMAAAWAVCLAGLVALSLYLGSESRSFLGVADSREQQISFEYPVSIKHIHVISGQAVRKGELLLELDHSFLNERIRLVRAQLTRVQSEKSLRHQLNLIVNNSTAGDLHDPLSVDIEDLSEQLESLEEQRKNLYVFASVDGIVGAVNFRRGEKAPSFAPVITLSPDSPSYVEGFIHESLKTKLEVGKNVTIVPLSSATKALEGKIVSVGSRIILIPVRFMSYPNMQVYGREVIVEIPKHNALLLGEKVQIKPKFDFLSFPQATASTTVEKESVDLGAVPQEITIPPTVAKKFAFEPSGLIYLKDLKKFLVISDDTDKEKTASLFLMNPDGTVEEQIMTAPGVGKISDLESISQDENYIYLLTSQGLNKKGKEKKNRNLLIRVKRSGLQFTESQVFDFKTPFVKALQESKDVAIKALFKDQDVRDLEIESHFVEGKNLYVGFKKPLNAELKTAVVVIENFPVLFEGGKLELKYWNTLSFEKVEGLPHRLSDLIKVQGQFFATTVCETETCGALWQLNDGQGAIAAKMIKFFPKDKPEGVAVDAHDHSLMVTFDQKDVVPKFLRVNHQGLRNLTPEPKLAVGK